MAFVIEHYPRLTTIFLSYIAAFLLFVLLGPDFFGQFVMPFGIGGIFIAGMLYTYSFTISLGALLLIPYLAHFSPATIAAIGGMGSAFADITIFNFIRHNLHAEVKKLSNSKILKAVGAAPLVRQRWFRDILGFILLASPIPDEIAIAVLASTKIKEDAFVFVAFIADVLGIYALVSVASFIY